MSEPEIRNIIASDGTPDINAMIQEVLREAYEQTTEDLRFYAEKVRHLNQKKKALRSYLTSLRDYKNTILSSAHLSGISLCSADKNDVAKLSRIFVESAHSYDVGPIEHELCIPNRVPSTELNSLSQLDTEIARWETELATLGDDSQLANVDLQNILQKQQQALQMMSNISKMTHDNAMAIIRNIRG